MRKLAALTAGVALLVSLGLTASPASAAPASPAKSAIAFVTPSNCFNQAFYDFKSVDGSGNTVDADAIDGTGVWNYSTSGASAALNSMILSSHNGHTWLANSNWSWGGHSITGKSLSASGSPQEWDPPAYWEPLASRPFMYAHFYDSNRPSVGVTVNAYPCNF